MGEYGAQILQAHGVMSKMSIRCRNERTLQDDNIHGI